MLYKKILVASSLLVVLFMLYLIPTKKEVEFAETNLEYVYPNDLETVYLLDSNDYVARVLISASNDSIISKATSLIDALTIGGKKENVIPNGFRSIIPSGTKVIDIELEDGVLIINFSKDILDIDKKYEDKMIESLTYTLTSINGIDSIKLLVDGKELKKLPNSNKLLPTFLDKSYGINKIYEITNVGNIDSYTVYFVNNVNDNKYYIPVTKYVNDYKQDKIRIIIDELASSFTYQSNLSSFLNENTKLLNYEVIDKQIKLNFNDMIFSDITNNDILEEVVYTICLSINDSIDIDSVVFLANDREILKKNISDLK
jgi:germination protein M